ncbi:hypothetical protein A2U01_0005247 [Trifolium medium]|uniref:Uncharacterized protein n=1 Tax=Trifolium medium TaxID=97028 RepID=A0A392MBD7_9FABA|nr:hypothetical protein [Trifolium medium]
MQIITEAYGWMSFNNMIGECNIDWVEEFYANAYGRTRSTAQCCRDEQVVRLRRSLLRRSMSLLCQARIGAMTATTDVHVCRLRRWSRSPRHGRIGWFATSSAARTKQRSSWYAAMQFMLS